MVVDRLPDGTGDDTEGDTGGRVLRIDALHLHANDIDALRRLAETDPELARELVDQKDRLDRREHASYRFGVVATSALVFGVLLSLSWILVEIGVLLSLATVMIFVAIALLMRVILTGEWSDTSVIGKAIDGIVRILGGTPKDD